MGSRIMHFIIANEISNRLSIEDKSAFLLGGVAPDAVAPKGESHFFEGDHDKFTRYIAYDQFFQKYQTKNSYVFGYYTHLIADDMWLQGFFVPWLKNSMEIDPTISEKYYGDFRLLNGKLLHHYQIEESVLEGILDADIMDLEEVKGEDVKEFIPYVRGDMDYSEEDLEAELQVFTFEQIVGYLETCIRKGIVKINELTRE